MQSQVKWFLTNLTECCKQAPSATTVGYGFGALNDWGSSGRKFESCRTDQFHNKDGHLGFS